MMAAISVLLAEWQPSSDLCPNYHLQSLCSCSQNPLCEYLWHLVIGVAPSYELEAVLIQDYVAMGELQTTKRAILDIKSQNT